MISEPCLLQEALEHRIVAAAVTDALSTDTEAADVFLIGLEETIGMAGKSGPQEEEAINLQALIALLATCHPKPLEHPADRVTISTTDGRFTMTSPGITVLYPCSHLEHLRAPDRGLS